MYYKYYNQIKGSHKQRTKRTRPATEKHVKGTQQVMLSKSQIIYTFMVPIIRLHVVSHYIVLFLRFVNTYFKYHYSRRPKVSFQIGGFDSLSDFNELIKLCVELIWSYEIFFSYRIITEIALLLLKLNFIVVFLFILNKN